MHIIIRVAKHIFYNFHVYTVLFCNFLVVIFGVFSNTIQGELFIQIAFGLTLTSLSYLMLANILPKKTKPDLDSVLLSRKAFGNYKEFIAGARTLKIFAISGLVMKVAWADIQELLDDGMILKVILINPANHELDEFLEVQIDETNEKRRGDVVPLIENLNTKIDNYKDKMELKVLDYLPGYSLTIVNSGRPTGRLSVEFWGFGHESINERMHIEISNDQTQKWFNYWDGQFDKLWAAATPVARGTPQQTTDGRT